MPLGILCGLGRDLEHRGAVHHDRNADAAGERIDGIAVAQPEAGIHPVERAGVEFIDDLQAGDDGQFPFPDRLRQEPFGAVIDIIQRGCQGRQGRYGVPPGIPEPLDEGTAPDVVAASACWT